MLMMVDYVNEMTVKKSCVVNMDRLSICSSCHVIHNVIYSVFNIPLNG